jgi:predicted permease
MSRKDRELDEELRAHLEMATRDRVDRGETPADAARAARAEFGNLTQVREVTRDMWGRLWLERLQQDARYAVRVLWRMPVFSAVAIVSLAVAMGANAAIMQVYSAVRLRPLPVASPDALVEITPASMDGARGSFQTWGPSLPNPVWERVRDNPPQAFSGTFAWGSTRFNLAAGGEVRFARALWVSGGFFDQLGIRPVRGRLFTAADDRPGCRAQAVVSEAFWRRELGAAESAIGGPIGLDSHAVDVIGVTPAAFFGLEVGRSFDVAVPICAEPALARGSDRLASGTTWWLTIMGRLKPGATLEQADAQLASMSPEVFRRTLAPNYPPISVPKYLAMTLRARPAATGISLLREQYEMPLTVLLALAGVVLLIACANLANLTLARTTARAREIAIRLGLGASRGRVVRQLLTEAAVLSIAGAAAGLVLARLFGRMLVSFVDENRSVFLDLGLDWRVLAFTAALAALTSIVFGLMPALRATRIGPAAVMNESGRGTTRDRAGVGQWLVVAQVAMSLLLIVGALLFARTLRNLAHVDPGFTARGIVVAGVDFRAVPLPAGQRAAFRSSVLERLRALPGVDAAAATAVVPLSGNAWGNVATVQGPDGPQSADCRFNRISDGYFQTLRTPLLAGRDFDQRDTLSAPLVAIVNQTFVRRFFGGRPVLGARFEREATPGEAATVYQIVGVVADAKYASLREEPQPVGYFPMTQEAGASPRVLVAIRSPIQTAALTASISVAMREVDPSIALSYDVLTEWIDRTLLRERLMARLSVFFAATAAGLALVGLYGVVAYGVAQRTREIGVRMALGATAPDVLRLILREAAALVAAGLIGGLALSLAAADSAETLLYGLRPRDPVSITFGALALALVAMLASYLPARRASRIQPVEAMRD